MSKEIIFMVPSLVGGGAERVISTLANYFSENGYKVRVFLVKENKCDYTFNPNVELRTDYVESGKIKPLRRMKHFRQCLKRYPDATIISFFVMFSLPILIAGFGLKNKIIVSERSNPEISLRSNSKLLKFLRVKLYERAYGLVFQTEGAKQYFNDKIQSKSVVIANPLKEGLPEPYFGERKKEIVSLARLEKVKNYPLLLDAFSMFSKEFPEYKLSIYGKGPLEEELRAKVKNDHMEDKVIFRGFEANVHQKVRQCAMFVLSSDHEGLSNAMLEAMALGLPCVCTDTPPGGARMFINSGQNGIITPVGNVTAFYQGMKQIAEDEERANEMGKNAAKIRSELTTEKICREWSKLIQDE